MGKTFADKFLEEYLAKQTSVKPAHKPRARSAKPAAAAVPKPEVPKPRAPSAKPVAVKPAAAAAVPKARAPAKPKVVYTEESCARQPPPCPPGCVEYTDKKGAYKCRSKPTVVKKEPVSPVVTRPPKVPIFAKVPSESEKAENKYPQLPKFAPNVRLNMPPPPVFSRWNVYKESMPLEGNVVQTPFEEEVEEAFEEILGTPQGQKQENLLEVAGAKIGLDIQEELKEEIKTGGEAIQTYNALRSLLNAQEKAQMLAEVKRITAEVDAIRGERKKVSQEEVATIQGILEKHELCKLVRDTETKAFQTGVHTGEHTLKYLRAVAKFLGLRGHSSAKRGELCFMIAQVITLTEAEFAQHLAAEKKARLSNVTKRLPKGK